MMYSTDEEGECGDRHLRFHEERNVGGPYNIDPSKSYKPACIVFMDLVISLTFILTSLMYFWFEIDNRA